VCFDGERERTSVLTGSQDGSSLALACGVCMDRFDNPRSV